MLIGRDGSPAGPFTVRCHEDATVADILPAVVEAVGADDGIWSLYSERTRNDLDPSADVGRSVAHGDHLTLHLTHITMDAGSIAADGLVEVVVTGGRFAGERFAAGVGSIVIGRDVRSGIAIADPLMSRPHAEITVTAEGNVSVTDLNSANGSYRDGIRIEGELAVGETDHIEMGHSLIAVRARPTAASVKNLEAGRVSFNRSPRMSEDIAPEPINLPAPPAHRSATRIQAGAVVLPIIFGVTMAVVLGRAFYLMFALLSPAMVIWNRITEGRTLRKLTEGGSDEFREAVLAMLGQLEVANAAETRRRQAASPDAIQLADAVSCLTPLLWSRRPADRDFLEVSVGWADQSSHQIISIEEGGEETLRTWAEELLAPFRTVSSVPVTLSLQDVGIVGIVGPEVAAEALGRWLIMQVAAMHSPRDVGIYAVVPSDTRDRTAWDWLTWLPHTTGTQALLELPTLAASQADAFMLADALANEVERRQQLASRLGTTASGSQPTIVVFVHGAAEIDRSTFQQLLSEGPGLGIHVVWIGSDRSNLPGECNVIVDTAEAAPRFVSFRVGGDAVNVGIADGVSVDYARDVARSLAPVRDSGATSSATEIPRSVPLVDILGVDVLRSESLRERWSEMTEGLLAPVGMSSRGIFTIDLERDGPHGLVGGMTNSGKSEFLQTFVLALAAHHAPDRLNFVLVDYKGGTAFRDCVDLPHTVGFVTDLDGHLVERALVSLNAEIKRRERVLRDHRAKDLSTLRQAAPAEAPASLVIVIDEFYALATELPEFVEGMVDVASRGRALGVHLILATQRPDDRVVDENIRANANLRVALRVGADTDSIGIVGVAAAARIDKSLPGRAFIKTGYDEIVEVQTAFAGGRDLSSSHDAVTVAPWRLMKRASTIPTPNADRNEGQVDSTRMATSMREAAADANYAAQRSPWLPELPGVVTLARLDEEYKAGPGTIVGLLDLPSQQLQHPWRYDFAQDGNLLVYGASGSGKTMLLRTFAASLASAVSPSDCAIYAFDFAAKGLAILEEMPHCGGVVTTGDTERVLRLLTFLEREIDERKDRFATAGVSNLTEMNRSVLGDRVRRIVVLMDSYGGFASAMENVDHGTPVTRFTRIVADGQSVGVNFIVTASRGASVPGSMAGLISSTLVLRMANEDEYISLNVPTEARAAEVVAGRGFINGRVEVQIALLTEDPSALAQNEALREIAAQGVDRFGDDRAQKLRTLSSDVARGDLPASTSPFQPYIGIEDMDLQPVAIDLEDAGFLVVGPPRSGRTTALVTLATSILDGDPSARLWLFAPRRSELTEMSHWSRAASGLVDCDLLAAELEGELADRDADSAPIFAFIDDGDELTETPGSRSLETVMRRSRDVGIRVVGAAEVHSVHRAFASWISEAKKQKVGLLLNPDIDIDGDIFGMRLPRSTQSAFLPGRGFLIDRGVLSLVQVAR